MRPLQIYAVGGYQGAITAQLSDLAAPLAECTANVPRRIGRFIQLALLGALRCRQQHDIPPDTAVYLASGRGDLETTLDILDSLIREGQVPRPLQFINAVSNAACFYVARQLALESPSNFVCNRFAAFEGALQLAAVDLAAGTTRSALVGCVDLVTLPAAEHRQRLGLDAAATIAEGSHWVWLGAAATARPRLGDLLDTRQFASRESLLQWLADLHLRSADCQLATGQFLDAADAQHITAATGLSQRFEYRNGMGYYDSQSCAAIAAFLRDGTARQLLHVNAEPPWGYNAFLVQR